ncbi:MAG: thiamine pyrophosphate-binding protein [Candidatus Melainabacteria bacterium]|nr:MAG: thiamine pyrophosphate-binding protein [Candidatus Melainabacteria bacterium]
MKAGFCSLIALQFRLLLDSLPHESITLSKAAMVDVMTKRKLAEYLFDRIKDSGVDTTFGIPGDFILPLYAAQEKTKLKTVVMTHEPSVGYAADAYARLKGLGVGLVTYGAGGLNMINSVGLAYAEESPLLIISGSPETRYRSQKPQLHHCVKNFDTQFNVFKEVTESQALLANPATAQDEIDRVFETTTKYSRPGYIEIPRDMVNYELDVQESAPSAMEAPSAALEEAVHEIIDRLKEAQQPVLFVGVEVRRFNLKDKVVALAEALNIPVVTSILGKASFPESHPCFAGNYFGQFGNPKVKEYVESADLILSLGTVLTEMETAGYTAKLPAKALIQCTAHEVTAGHHTYHGVNLRSLIDQLIDLTTSKVKPTLRFSLPSIEPELIEPKNGDKNLTVAHMINQLNDMMSEKFAVVSDVGDCLYAGMSLKTDIFIAPGYYSSMGFGVPAGIGAQIANPKRRSIILVGDGGFQMTGMEISTAIKLGINPIVILFNNASYAMLRFIDQKRDYYDLQRWDYALLAKALGGKGVTAQTPEEFKQALKDAKNSDSLFLIDARISEDDISPTLRRLTDHFGKKVKASIS